MNSLYLINEIDEEYNIFDYYVVFNKFLVENHDLYVKIKIKISTDSKLYLMPGNIFFHIKELLLNNSWDELFIFVKSWYENYIEILDCDKIPISSQFGRKRKILNTSKTHSLGKLYENIINISEFVKLSSSPEFRAIGTIVSHSRKLRIINSKVDFEIINLNYISSFERIAIVPLHGKKGIFESEFVENCNGTEFYKYKLSSKIAEETYKLLSNKLEYLANNYDIIMFPEMVVPKEMIEILRSFIKSSSNLRTSLWILGSITENGRNYCTVLNKFGNIISTQYKFNGFLDREKNRMEYLTNEVNDKKIILLDIEGLGRITTPICLDYIKNRNDYTDMGINYCFIPAYSRNIEYFKTTHKLMYENKTVSFLANSCSALKRNETILMELSLFTKGRQECIELDKSYKQLDDYSIALMSCYDECSCLNPENDKICIFEVKIDQINCFYSKKRV